ncbi:MAG: type II toxin-antitoxin system VapC family toxin [Desulfobacterales bacterium]|nr:type II toxin-antitoxin system VapC family toxin [Desulfobacterales bacterium]
MNELLLDTHVWIWLSMEDRKSLSARALRALQQASLKFISAISCWELAKLVEKRRMGLSIPTLTWIQRSLKEFDIRLVELTAEIAVESTLINGMHADPADQIIAATSRVTGMPLLTSDKRLRQLQGVEVIW